MTQQALADELGIGIQSIRNYENDSLDRIPSTVQLKMLKDFYGVTYEYLLDEDCNNGTTDANNRHFGNLWQKKRAVQPQTQSEFF